MSGRAEQKTVILFTPSSLLKVKPFFSFLKITRSGNIPTFSETAFKKEYLEILFGGLPLALRSNLENFTIKGLDRFR